MRAARASPPCGTVAARAVSMKGGPDDRHAEAGVCDAGFRQFRLPVRGASTLVPGAGDRVGGYRTLGVMLPG